MGRTPRRSKQNDAYRKPEELETWERLCLAYKVDSVADLAEAMDLPLGTVKNWKGRGSVPLQYCVKARNNTGRSLDWIILGVETLSLAEPVREGDLSGEAGAGQPRADGVQLPNPFNDVMVVVLDRMRSLGMDLPSEKLARLAELVYEFESMRCLAYKTRANLQSVRQIADRYLSLLA